MFASRPIAARIVIHSYPQVLHRVFHRVGDNAKREVPLAFAVKREAPLTFTEREAPLTFAVEREALLMF